MPALRGIGMEIKNMLFLFSWWIQIKLSFISIPLPPPAHTYTAMHMQALAWCRHCFLCPARGFPQLEQGSTCAVLLCVCGTHLWWAWLPSAQVRSWPAYNHQPSFYRHKVNLDIKQASCHTWRACLVSVVLTHTETYLHFPRPLIVTSSLCFQ